MKILFQHRLSGGIGELLPPDFLFSQSTTQQNRGDAITILAVWALLLNRTELALCLCAYVSHPIAFSLVLAKTARGLAHEVNMLKIFHGKTLRIHKVCRMMFDFPDISFISFLIILSLSKDVFNRILQLF